MQLFQMSSQDLTARTSVQDSSDPSNDEERKTQILDSAGSVTAFEGDQRRSIKLESTSGQIQLAHIYRVLSEQNKQIRQLASAFQSSAMRLQENITGSPEAYLESSSSWCPHRYTSDSQISPQLFVYAIKQMKGTSWSTKFFLAYAETPSRWHRVIVMATSACDRDFNIGTDVTIPDNSECTLKLLPKFVEEQLISLISGVKHFTSVTPIPIVLQKDLRVASIPGPCRVEELKDDVELEHDTLKQAIPDLQDLGCKIVSESDVVVRSRIASSIFDVQVGRSRYAEQKVPFATAGKDGENGFADFITDLKTLHCLQGYNGIAGFGGVVLDEPRKCLKGYLSEVPAICSLTKLIATLNSRSEEIPWPLRQAWAAQIVKLVAGLHCRDRVLGVLDTSRFGVRADGRVVLTRFQTSHRHLGNAKGVMPPELRQNLDEHSNNVFNFKTDIFQLGYILWLLVQQKCKYRGLFCTINACTNLPRHACQEPHTNPIELPHCGSKEVPQIFKDQIRACRSNDPKDRPSACNLARALEQNTKTEQGWFESHARDKVAEYASTCASTSDTLVCCYECGTMIVGVYHHCDSCYQGDFDICQICLQSGVTCLEPQRHHLMRRRRTRETITHGA